MYRLKIKDITDILKYFLISSLFFSPQSAIGTNFFTSFEFTDKPGGFELGSDPAIALFSNGEAKFVDNSFLYLSGANAWMIDSGDLGVIEFSIPKDQVTLSFIDRNTSINSVLNAFDLTGNELTSINGNSNQLIDFEFSSVSLGAAIANITLVNKGSEGYTVIDDFESKTTDDNLSDPLIPISNPFPEKIKLGSIRGRLKAIATGLTAPNWGANAPGENEFLYISDQNGILWKINLVNGEKSQYLDLSSRLVPLGVFGENSFDERGFLGFAFHPEFQANRKLYTYTSEPADGIFDFSTLPSETLADHKSVILQWQLSADDVVPMLGRPDTLQLILEIEQPQFNHNGGGLTFGLDNLLYISLGDGGGADDVDSQVSSPTAIVGHGSGNGQDISNPLGSLLRIDPDGTNASNGKYGIPADNPFVNDNTAVAEIFAYGFRNPFRFSFDHFNGDLYLADVGQNAIEEVDKVVSGGNYGWNQKEGSFDFNPNGNGAAFISSGTAVEGLIDPVLEYDHDEGKAIIGGFVYRGKTIRELEGKYIFADFESPEDSMGRLFYDNNGAIEEFQLTLSEGLKVKVTGFGQDAHGEIYLLGNQTGTPFGETGIVLKILANSNFDGNIVDIPVVDVINTNGSNTVYYAKLRLIPDSQPLLFELTPEFGILPDEYTNDNASFNTSTGKLSLPFVNLQDTQGNIVTYAAELKQNNTDNGLIFELVNAQLIK